jgi:hypothetical protein
MWEATQELGHLSTGMEPEQVYVGALRRVDRTTLFSQVYENEAQLMRLNRAVRGPTGEWQWREDPYLPESWPSSEEEYEAATDYQKDLKAVAVEERYKIGDMIHGTEGARHAIINRVTIVEKEAGYVDNLRRGMPEGVTLVLKRLSFFGASIGEREILVAYHLRELVYGYSQLLSLHFMMVLDWWMAPKGAALSHMVRPTQFVVYEALDQTLWWRIRRAFFTGRDSYLELSLRELRAILFQVLSALEVAWLTHRFVHGDLHLGNVMMKVCGEDSPLHNRAWLYRRYNDPDYWYVLPPEAHGNQLVKLIDFDRSSLNIPLDRDHDRPLGGIRHNHPQQVAHNKYNTTLQDTDLFLRKLATNEHMQWRVCEKEDPEGVRQLRTLCFNEVALSASQILNDAFFAPLRRRLPGRDTLTLDLHKMTTEHVVLSFATTFHELNARGPPDLVVPVEPTPGPADGGMTFSGTFHEETRGPLCLACGMRARLVTLTGETFLCRGRTCYEFLFCFAQRTAIKL